MHSVAAVSDCQGGVASMTASMTGGGWEEKAIQHSKDRGYYSVTRIWNLLFSLSQSTPFIDGQGRAQYTEAKAIHTDLFARVVGYRKKSCHSK